MSKKGLSAEEKRTKMLELLHETKEFYKLVELEKLAPKSKGITAMSVKEVLTDLLNDNLVRFEKVGISSYYWSFPSEAGAALSNKKAALDKTLETLRADRDREQAAVQVELAAREETDERKELLEQYATAKENLRQLELESAKYVACDPILFEKKKQLVEDMKALALAWTDNVSTALCYFRDTHGADARDQLKESLGISDDFEDLVFP
ncbi:hypothetical protein RQP46_004815 [Phenoliferia psychrophenolica]